MAIDEETLDLLNFRDMENIVGPDVLATVITTSCYSGGWAIQPNVNMIILIAAGPEKFEQDFEESKLETDISKSWPLSNSISRACGSIFASTLIQSLTASITPLLAGKITCEGEEC